MKELADLVPKIDFVFCKCSLNKFVFFLIVVYIPPDLPIADYEAFLEALEISLISKPFILIGDFNIPTYNKHFNTCHKLRILQNLSNSLDVVQHNNIPNNDGKLLDLIFSNLKRPMVVDHAKYPFVKEDFYHPALSVSTDLENSDKFIPFPAVNSDRFNFRKANFNKLYDDLWCTDWSSVTKCTHVNQAVKTFYDLLYSTIKSSVPFYTKNRSTFPPWFTADIIFNLKLKHRCRRKWRVSGSVVHLNEFKRLRSYCKSQISLAYSNYMSKIEQSILSDPREVYKYVQMKKGITRIPGIMYHENLAYESPQEIINAFASSFSGIFTSGSNVDYEDVHTNRICFDLQSVTEDELIQIMARFFHSSIQLEMTKSQAFSYMMLDLL
ncbi:hypothetical protein Zmor_002391 [Zophobas morio]|uniref:Endonuclease/exonuclease/phosphatase domain-containing protein n=1 Tax=Zophobas morio TaxID=2755281 RepID=A0AA38J0Q1_9CUCU|nr:hypothetical protein Zmor_002391 [Zophobas morio]